MNKLSYPKLEMRTTCRACSTTDFFDGFNFGTMPIANELLSKSNQEAEVYPLNFKICSFCGLGQIMHDINPERLFTDYRYTSSTSSTMLKHSELYVKRILEDVKFESKDYVLEIACNDGYLLRNFSRLGITSIGVDPAANLAKKISSSNIKIEIGFFSKQLALSLFEKYGYPRLIIGNNVFAHVPNINDFMEGLEILCGDKTLITLENPSLMNIPKFMQLDTIYHEHFSYISTHAVDYLATKHHLNLCNVEQLSIHGGSNRYFLKKKNRKSNRNRIEKVLGFERNEGLFKSSTWSKFSEHAKDLVDSSARWFKQHDSNPVFGYGAAAKASTILNVCNIESNELLAIGDNSSEKVGKFMPKAGIPIISLNEFIAKKPETVVIFPWNIKTEIVDSLRRNGLHSAKFWQIVPVVEEIK